MGPYYVFFVYLFHINTGTKHSLPPRSLPAAGGGRSRGRVRRYPRLVIVTRVCKTTFHDTFWCIVRVFVVRKHGYCALFAPACRPRPSPVVRWQA